MWSTQVKTGAKYRRGSAASMDRRGESGGVRTTLDLPRHVHRTLKRLAADQDTSLQALVVAAILQTYPDLA